VRIRYLTTGASAVQLEVIRSGRRLARVARSAVFGRNAVTWNAKVEGRPAKPGVYVLRVTAVAGDGRTASDEVRVRVRKPRT
jgi:hypothetical protein